MIARNFLVYSNDFDVCTGRTRICFNKKVQQEIKNVLVEGLYLFSIKVSASTDLSHYNTFKY